jgi:hypothetical protein
MYSKTKKNERTFVNTSQDNSRDVSQSSEKGFLKTRGYSLKDGSVREPSRPSREPVRDLSLREQSQRDLSQRDLSLQDLSRTSSVESKQDNDKYKQLSKKLKNDRDELKVKLKKTIEDHKVEIEKTSHFYQGQINNLVNERDKISIPLIKKLEEDLKNNDGFEKMKKALNEKESQIMFMKKQYEEEINRHVSEKNACISTLQGLKETETKKYTTFEKQKNEQIIQMKADMDRMKGDYDRKFISMDSEYKQNIEKIKKDCESKMLEQDRLQKVHLENNKKINDNSAKVLALNTRKEFDSKISCLEKEIAELNFKMNQEKAEKEKFEKIKTELEKKVSIMENTFKEECEKNKKYFQDEFNMNTEKKEKEIKNILLNNEKKIGELQDLNIRQQEQLNQAGDMLKKMQETINNNSNQAVMAMNRHKEITENELKNKNKLIESLQQNFEKLSEEASERIISTEKKVKSLIDENKDLIAKIPNLKNTIDQYDKIIQSQKVDIARSKQENFQLLEKINLNHTEREILKIDVAQKKKEIEFLVITNNANKQEWEKLKFGLMEESRQKLINTVLEKDKVISDLNSKIAVIEKNIKVTEQNREKVSTTIATITAERDKLKNSIDRFVQEIDTKTKALQEAQMESVNLKNNFNGMVKDLSMKNEEVLTYKTKLKEMDNKDKQILSLTTQLSNFRESFKQTIDKITEEHRKEREELCEYRKKHNETDEKLKELYNLKASITSTQENCRATLIKKDVDHQKETQKLNTKIREQEMKILNTEQDVERIKLDYLKKLREATELPPKDKDRLLQLEKEAEEMKVILNDYQSKIGKAQMDSATAIASLKVREENLKAKEEELRIELTKIKSMKPILLDPEFRKQRDVLASQLREQKLEMAKVKDENVILAQKLKITEDMLKR